MIKELITPGVPYETQHKKRSQKFPNATAILWEMMRYYEIEFIDIVPKENKPDEWVVRVYKKMEKIPVITTMEVMKKTTLTKRKCTIKSMKDFSEKFWDIVLNWCSSLYLDDPTFGFYVSLVPETGFGGITIHDKKEHRFGIRWRPTTSADRVTEMPLAIDPNIAESKQKFINIQERFFKQAFGMNIETAMKFARSHRPAHT